MTISMQSRSGHSNMPAIVGVALFTQFWYWFPASHFLSLAFTPTALIGVNADLNLPEIEFTSNARPSLFAYIPPTKPPAAVAVEKVATAVLSTTAKAQAKAKKAKSAESDAMDEDEKPDAKVCPLKILFCWFKCHSLRVYALDSFSDSALVFHFAISPRRQRKRRPRQQPSPRRSPSLKNWVTWQEWSLLS